MATINIAKEEDLAALEQPAEKGEGRRELVIPEPQPVVSPPRELIVPVPEAPVPEYYQPRSSGLIAPADEVVLADAKLLDGSGLSQADIERYAPAREQQTEADKERLHATTNPFLFLAQHILQKAAPSCFTEDVYRSLREQANAYSDPLRAPGGGLDRLRAAAALRLSKVEDTDLERETADFQYCNGEIGERESIKVIKAGPVERLAITLVRLVNEEPLLRQTEVLPLAVLTANELLRQARLAAQSPALPEMPGLVAEIKRLLQGGGVARPVRYICYDLLEQLSLPGDTAAAALDIQLAYNDVGHSLAYSLAVQLTDEARDAPCLQKQAAKRQELLALLGASAREMFDAYPRLKHRAADLITGADLSQPGAVDSLLEAEFVQGSFETFGVQGLFPPLTDGAALPPALLTDIIAFRSKITGISAGVPESRIALDSSKRYEFDQIVWGRICTVVDNPEARLNALLILRDPLLFRAYDCSAYLESFEAGSRDQLAAFLAAR